MWICKVSTSLVGYIYFPLFPKQLKNLDELIINFKPMYFLFYTANAQVLLKTLAIQLYFSKYHKHPYKIINQNYTFKILFIVTCFIFLVH